jgi:hypothetical protein
MSTTDPIADTSLSAKTNLQDNANDTLVEYLVMKKTLETLLKRSEDDSSEEGSVGSLSSQISQPMAETMARYVTGFGL